MDCKKIKIVGQEHQVVRPDEAGIPTDTAVPAGIVVIVDDQIVSASMRIRLGIEENLKPKNISSNTGSSGRPAIPTSRWDRVETPFGGSRLIG
jgi:hypothetical protein